MSRNGVTVCHSLQSLSLFVQVALRLSPKLALILTLVPSPVGKVSPEKGVLEPCDQLRSWLTTAQDQSYSFHYKQEFPELTLCLGKTVQILLATCRRLSGHPLKHWVNFHSHISPVLLVFKKCAVPCSPSLCACLLVQGAFFCL